VAKIKLGQRPKNFPKPIEFPMLDGTQGHIKCLFKYRTRTEFGRFIDELAEAAGKQGDAGKFSVADLMEKTRDSNAAYLLRVLDGWDLDEEISREVLQQLCDEVPAAATAIMEGYRAAINEGRLGN